MIAMKVRFYKVIFLLVVIVVFFQSCFTMRVSKKKTIKDFKENNIPVKIIDHNLSTVDYKVRVVNSSFNAEKDIAIFFIHGAPGSSESFYQYLKDATLLEKANLYSIDRPGYGYSNFGKSETSITKQAKVAAEIIDSLPEKNVIVVGHSFGGPIAAYSSLLSPKIKQAVMLAPAIDPENEKFFKITYFAKWKLTKWMVPGAFAIAGDEKFSHVNELIKIKEDWVNIGIPVTHMHGNKDVIVPFENLNFSKTSFNQEYLDTIVLDEENHFIPWSKYDFIKDKLLEIIEEVKAK